MNKPIPSVHRSVHFFDREELLAASQQDRAPEPYAAIITRVHRDVAGNVTGKVGLTVFDPELGPQIKHDVPQGENYDAPEANRWYFTPYQQSPVASPAGAEHPLTPEVATLRQNVATMAEDVGDLRARLEDALNQRTQTKAPIPAVVGNGGEPATDSSGEGGVNEPGAGGGI